MRGILMAHTQATRRNHKRLIVAVCGLAVLSGVLLWEEGLHDQVIPKRWGVVEPGLIYRSGQISARLVEATLRKYKISTIVSLTFEDPNDRNQSAERLAAERLGINLQRYPLAGDGTGDIRNYAKAVAAIAQAERSGKPVLVHCAAGAQRTGGVVAFYRLLVERRPVTFVYRELRKYGWKPSDSALIKYVNTNMAAMAELLQQMGVTGDIPNPLPVLASP
jgi:protein tyrosine/serine phosphatase